MTSAPLSPLDKKTPPCTVSDCPRPDSEAFHRAVCGHQWRLTHVHHPKVGAGGNNPKAKIRCVACMDCHSKADNYGGMNTVESIYGQRFIAWKGWHSEPDKREILWDVPMDGEIVRIDEGTGSRKRFDNPRQHQASSVGNLSADDDFRKQEVKRREREDSKELYQRSSEAPSSAPILRDQRADIEGEITFEEWVYDWETVIAPTSRNSKGWWPGDRWAYAEDRFPDRLYQIAEELCRLAELDPRTISNYANVCRSIPPERRRAELTFAHHNAVYTLPESEQEALLDLAIRDGLSSRELKALAKPESAERDPSIKVSILEEWLHEFMEGYNAEIQAVLLTLGRHIRARLEARDEG